MIMDIYDLPFKVGELVETKSFVSGYRGAWFRSKIKNIGRRRGGLCVAVEYLDFPDEKLTWTKLYQKPSKHKNVESRLMVRPSFPCMYHEAQAPDINSSSEVIVILINGWKVGDLVDWFSDGCYWSGRLTKKLGGEKFQLKLFPPPEGEGLSYEASCKELRPFLDWSPEHGWTVPLPEGNEDHHPCARVVKPSNQDCQLSPPDELEKTGTPLGTTTCIETQTRTPTASLKTKPFETNRNLCVTDSAIYKTNSSDNVSDNDNGSSKKMRIDRSIILNSMGSDSIEDAIIDLEELVNRVKWMKDILEFGMPLPDTVRPSWEFVEHCASSLQN